MIVMETMTSRALGAWTPVAPHVAASPSSHGMRPLPTTPLSTRGQVCPQAVAASIPAVPAAAVARVRVDVRGLGAALVAGTADLAGFGIDFGNDERTTQQYGKAPHDTGTRACRPPV